MRPGRRTIALVIVALSILATTYGIHRYTSRPKIRNLVLIVVDTLRQDHIGCYGYDHISTPAIDSLSRQGTTFDEAITPVPITAPAFASILTSCYPPVHGVRDNGLFSLSDDALTLTEVLEERGFRTAAITGSSAIDSAFGLHQGFSVYDDDFGGRYRPHSSVYRPLAAELGRSRRRAEEVTRLALRWIVQNRESRFFVMLHYYDPHTYYDPPAPFDSLYAGRPYDGEIAYTDRELGVFLGEMLRLGLLDETLIVFTADHGEGLGEHSEDLHGHLIYDSTLEVPLILRGPGIPADVRITQVASLIDIAPTALSLLGVRPPAGFQGRDLTDLWRGADTGSEHWVYCETYRTRLRYNWSELVGIRSSKWKYIRAPEQELYDVAADPGETTNLFGRGVPEERSIVERCEAFRESMPLEDMEVAGEVRLDPELLARLEALGYVGGADRPPAYRGSSLPDPKYHIEELNRRFWAGFHTKVAAQLLRAGDAAGAVRAFQRAVEEDPTDPVRLMNLGSAYLQLREYEESAAAYEKALSIDPDHVPSLVGLGQARECLGEGSEAQRAYRAALEVDPGYQPAVHLLARLLIAGGRYREAIARLGPAVRADPRNPSLLKVLTTALLKSGGYEEAAPHLATLAALMPQSSEWPFQLGGVMKRLGRYEEAVDWYGRAIELDPNLAEAYHGIACVNVALGRRSQAIPWLKQAVTHGMDVREIRADPALESLRGDPAFEALLEPGPRRGS